MGCDQAFREALSHFPSGVTILTVRTRDGLCHGMTLSAFSSLSLQPALIVACVDRRARCHAELGDGMPFGISILADRQADVAKRFASPVMDRFDGIACRLGATGVPLIEGACAHLECRVARRHFGGDHSIVVGEVLRSEASGGQPLVYARRAYFGLLGPCAASGRSDESSIHPGETR